MNPLVWLIGAGFLTLGVLAYTGRWRRWMGPARGYGTFIGFSLLYIGIAFLAASAGVTVWDAATPVAAVLFGIAAIALVIAIVGLWWMPRMLQPRWYRELRARALTRKTGR